MLTTTSIRLALPSSLLTLHHPPTLLLLLFNHLYTSLFLSSFRPRFFFPSPSVFSFNLLPSRPLTIETRPFRNECLATLSFHLFLFSPPFSTGLPHSLLVFRPFSLLPFLLIRSIDVLTILLLTSKNLRRKKGFRFFFSCFFFFLFLPSRYFRNDESILCVTIFSGEISNNYFLVPFGKLLIPNRIGLSCSMYDQRSGSLERSSCST